MRTWKRGADREEKRGQGREVRTGKRNEDREEK